MTTTRCCNASFVEMDGGFWYVCSACDREVNPDDPPVCPGSFTLNYREINRYWASCNVCGRTPLRFGVGYIQYGHISGALQPHDPPVDSDSEAVRSDG